MFGVPQTDLMSQPASGSLKDGYSTRQHRHALIIGFHVEGHGPGNSPRTHEGMNDIIPASILEDLRRLRSEGRSGTIILHMKDGVIRGAEYQPKIVLGLCTTSAELTAALTVT